MSETPNTNNGRVLERIMRNLWELNLPTNEYNKIYSAVLTILDEEYEEPKE